MHIPQIYPVAAHTDNVGHGSTFVAIHGYQSDGVKYIPTALDKGATTIVVHQDASVSIDIQDAIQSHNATLIKVADTRLALAQLSAQAADYPARKLRIIAITGTKGKTTSAFLLEHVLRSAGYTTALLGTVKNSIMDNNLGVGLTTQQPDYLHQFFKLCVEANVDYVVMEVAAQALTLHRTYGLEFVAVLFTNFSQEHAEFYTSLEDYFAAKSLIVEQLKNNAPFIVNGDDAWCNRLNGYSRTIRFGLLNEAAEYKAQRITKNSGLVCDIVTADSCQQLSCPSLIGTFNVYNVLGVYTLACSIGIDSALIAQALHTFTKVPGRLERHPLPNGSCCIIDYAHNPSSFESVLSTLRSLTDHLVVVFGCGGDRDKTKRPVMGAIAAQYADLVVLTADNPRSEQAAEIIDDIVVGIAIDKRNKVISILDRKEAIEYAYDKSKTTTLIALLGKGPDEYQIIGTEKSYFSEASIIKALAQ